jgi:tetratricopeptide (TPR) repeat protein
VNLANVAVTEGRFKDALSTLRPLLDAKGSANDYLLLQGNLAAAQAGIGLKDYARAEHDLEQELTGAQRAGMRFDTAKIYYLLGTSARLSGHADRAAGYYREAVQLLDAIRSDPGAENILRRADVKTMYDESNRWKK